MNTLTRVLGTASIFLLFAAGAALCQMYDLGPHNIDNRGCLGCHVLHVPVVGFEAEDDSEVSLWGKESKYLSYTTTGRDAVAIEEEINRPQDPISHTTVCLACHDASIAKLGMVGRADPLGTSGASFAAEDQFARTFTVHPVHVPYLPNTGCDAPTPSCNPNHWPSLIDSSGVLKWTQDQYSTRFVEIYPRSVRFYATADNGGRSMVECASCHDPHSQGYTDKRTADGRTILVRSKSFVRGWYDVDDKKNDPVSKFCRSCHYASSNEFVEKKT